jgi:flagellin
LGNGDGTFGAQTNYSVASEIYGVAVGDVDEDGALDFVTSSQTPDNQAIFLGNAVTTSGTATMGISELSGVDLTSSYGASAALSTLESARSQVDRVRAGVGAGLSRLGAALSNVEATRSVLEEAYHRIIDADVAIDVAELVRLTIKEQAATAILAQANLSQSSLIQLLLGS